MRLRLEFVFFYPKHFSKDEKTRVHAECLFRPFQELRSGRLFAEAASALIRAWNESSVRDRRSIDRKTKESDEMFCCQNCKKTVPSGTRSTKIVVQIREKEYSSRGADPSERRRRFTRGRRPRSKKQKYDRGGRGYEIVREIMVCPECATTMEPAVPPQPAVPVAESADSTVE